MQRSVFVMDNQKYAVIINNIVKKIKGNIVLNNIDLKLKAGRIYGLQGRNGSGKTMLLRSICGLIVPDSGDIIVNGVNITSGSLIPDKIGVIIENPGFIGHYSGFKNLSILASIRGEIDDKKIYDTLSLVGLDQVANKKVKTYSLGMKQRLGLAQAIMEDPELILLDEPTNGLDKDGVEILYNILTKLKIDGRTIILASHNKEDIDSLCDEVFFMENGELLANSYLEAKM
jgi:ABC-2 type transport system ATP-binding protein